MKKYAFLLLTLLEFSVAHTQNTAAKSGTKESIEMGNLLAVNGKYEDAYAYFQYAVKSSSSRELYNNTGVIAVLSALRYFRPNEPEVRFLYPLELNFQSKTTKDVQDYKETRNRILQQAISYFDSANKLDANYAPAYLNKACALTLLGDATKAQSTIKLAAQKTSYPKTLVDVKVLQGILYAQQGNTTKASEAFSSAAAGGSAIAAHNQKILKNEKITPPNKQLNFDEEAIDGMPLSDPYNLPQLVPSTKIEVNSSIHFYRNDRPGPQSYYYFSDNQGTGLKNYFLLTAPNYSGQTAKKLKIGALQNSIKTAYGTPKTILETGDGQVWAYSSILFILNNQGKLLKWAIFGEHD